MPKKRQRGKSRHTFVPGEILLAYRKAKSDLYHENYQVTVVELARYEENLENNINRICDVMNSSPSWYQSPAFEIRVAMLPKLEKSEEARSPSVVSNNDFLEWERSMATRENAPGIVFKPISQASIDAHVISALWISKVGEKMDMVLAPNIYGSRVARTGKRRYHDMASASSFGHYPSAYRKWQRGGTTAIRGLIDAAQDAVAILWDFSSFYQSIDPGFIISEGFRERMDRCRKRNFYDALTEQDWEFTAEMAAMMQSYGYGLPVGIAASAIFANMVLNEIDARFETLSPTYYGRYMDDLFLVLHNKGRMRTIEEVRSHIMRVFNATGGEGDIAICMTEGRIEFYLPNSVYGKTALSINLSKEKCFIVDHASDHEFINRMESTLAEVSSERRFLPDSTLMDGESARAILTNEDSFSTNDMLLGNVGSLRRMGLANVISSLRFFAQTFSSGEWANERKWLLRVSVDHVFAPQRIFEMIRYAPRIIALFVSASDTESAVKAANTVKRSVYYCWCKEAGSHLDDSQRKVILGFYEFVCRWIVEEAISAIAVPYANAVSEEGLSIISRIWLALSSKIDDFDSGKTIENIVRNAQKIAAVLVSSDLSYHSPSLVEKKPGEPSLKLVSESVFASLCNSLDEDYRNGAALLFKDELPPHFMVFPTRRMPTVKVCKLRPDVCENIVEWRSVIRFVRGGRFGGPSEPLESWDGVKRFSIAKSCEHRNIAVVSILTEDSDFSRSLSVPNVDRKRYEKLSKLVNDMIRSDPKPHYVLFPELSVPLAFSDVIGQRLAKSGISSIMGVEYVKMKNGPNWQNGTVGNQVHLYLVDRRFGYSSLIFQVEDKGSPAIHEREELRQQYGYSLHNLEGRRPGVYFHDGMAFAVLVCSELTNISYRANLSGGIDVLFVPAWNQDLTTFSALAESSALDLHCYVAIANNRKYGDSRLRGPYSDDWRRDIVRIRGGIHDYVAVGTVDVSGLRAFQSNHISPKEPYKPMPDGYRVQKWRKSYPWKKIRR
jgi:hypothetical protein